MLGGLATGTRLLGLALLPALASCSGADATRARSLRLAPLLLLPAAVGLYALYLDSTLGDPWAFTSAQADWDRERSPLGPLGGCSDSVHAAGRGARDLLDLPARGPGHEERVALWNVSHLALLVAAGWLTWVAWRRLGAAFGVYSVATLAIVLSVPAEGFPLVSLPRFLLGDFPLFLALASLTLDHPRRARCRPVRVRRARSRRRGGVRARASGSRKRKERAAGGTNQAAVEHSLPQVQTPWRTATLVASAVAALELVALVVVGVVLLAKPVSRARAAGGARRRSSRR